MDIFRLPRGYHRLIKTGDCLIELDNKVLSPELLVSDVNVSLAERATVIQCFNDYNYIFAFGHNPEISQYTITFSGFLVDNNECRDVKTGKVVKDITKYYLEKRVSKTPKLIPLTIGSTTFDGILVGMTLDGMDVELNMITVTMTLLAVVPPKA